MFRKWVLLAHILHPPLKDIRKHSLRVLMQPGKGKPED